MLQVILGLGLVLAIMVGCAWLLNALAASSRGPAAVSR